MKTLCRITLTSIFLLTAVIAACQTCGNKPAIRPIDKACLPAGRSPSQIQLYREDVEAPHRQIAYIDSCKSEVCYPKDKTKAKNKDTEQLIEPEEVRKMLEDLKAKARSIGADAVVRVKMEHNRRTGFVENPETPFWSVKQDESRQYFFHGIAIKFDNAADIEHPGELRARNLASPQPTQADQLVPERAGTLPIKPNSVPQAGNPSIQGPKR